MTSQPSILVWRQTHKTQKWSFSRFLIILKFDVIVLMYLTKLTIFTSSLFLQISEIEIFKNSQSQISSSSFKKYFSKNKKSNDTNTFESKTKYMFEKSTNFKNDRKWSRQSKRRKRSDSSHFLESSSGFHPLSQIEFLSSFNFSDPFDPQLQPANSNSEDPTPIVPVTEMSDLELKRLGFPVPATTTESIYSMLHGFSGPGSHDLSSVIDSPYIKFTSRK